MTATLGNRPRRTPGPGGTRPRWALVAMAAAATWSLVYLGLGIAWLAGAGGNPADPAVDEGATLSLLGALGPQKGAILITGLAGLGVLLSAAMTFLPPTAGRVALVHRLVTPLAGTLGVVLAVVLPDYRLLAAVAYTPILLVLMLFGAAPDNVSLWQWPEVNLAVLSLAGLAWIAAAAAHRQRIARAGIEYRTGGRGDAWTKPDSVARWGRWATAIAVAVPLGYATTRYAWALGIPLGVDQQLLDDLGNGVYAGAGLATLAVGGSVLTLGLVQRWGEVFPRWMLGLRGRRVPVGLAVVPAAIVSVSVTSAGLMFLRFGFTGKFGATFPGANNDVAAWLPEMFWPLWGIALAVATYAYWLRRRDSATSLAGDPRLPSGRRLSPGAGTPGPEPGGRAPR